MPTASRRRRVTTPCRSRANSAITASTVPSWCRTTTPRQDGARIRPRYPLAAPGAVAEWLRRGLQSRLPRFDSGRRLGRRLPVAPQRGEDARGEDRGDDGERDLRADLADELGRGQLRPDEDQQRRERGLEVVEALDEVGDEEEQRPQAEQRERVGREDDEGVVRDREDGRHGVDREQDVDQRDARQRRPLGRERELLADPSDQLLLAVVVVPVAEQPPASPDQERREHEAEPAEGRQRRGSHDDERSAEDERDDDAVREQSVALRLRDREGAEHQQED